VTQVFEDGVEVAGERLRSYNVIWAAGVRAHPVVQSLGVDLGPGGRVKVQPDCSIPGHPNVFVIGDAAYLIDSKTGHQVPGVSQGALQMGRYVAKVIREDLAGKSKTRQAGFHYKDLGSMATVGKSRAVAEVGPFHISGFLAWLAWLILHITVLIGFRNRISVFVSWIYAYVFFRRGSRLITRTGAAKLSDDAALAGLDTAAAGPKQ
jgi:NADH dehydrogenase